MHPSGTGAGQKALFSAFILAFAGLILAVTVAGIQIHRIFLKMDPARFKSSGRLISTGKPDRAGIHFEVYPEEEIPGKSAFTGSEDFFPEKLPRVAILIDDLGYDKILADKFLNLGACLAFSILPHSPFQAEISEAAHERGYDVLLHLPMEPMEFPKIDPGPHALLMSMS
ncbi:MAG: divergent polysaccharide deacetylase family protein, partial [Thermodesulfobacteriota bacterium]